MDSYFRIICERCGVHFLGHPAPDFPNLSLPPNAVTISSVEYCPFCVMQSRPVSPRTQFLCKVVKELEEFKSGTRVTSKSSR